MQLANDTRQAFFAAVAARESVHYQEQVEAAAETGAELARRMVSAGNWNLLDQAHEQSFYAAAGQRLTQARLTDALAREKLLRLMGLPGEQPDFTLDERLPELPPRIEDLPDIEQAVLQSRIDLRLKRTQLDELARNLGLTKATRFVNVLDVGPTRVQQGTEGAPYERGYEITLEIPLFDAGGPRLRRAEALYSQAVERFTQAAIDARSQIRRSYAAYRAAFDTAKRQRDEVMPTAKAVAAQNLLRYNASLISVFDLLADARDQIASVDDYIQSVRDFWVAKSVLDAALLGDSSP
jgi:outer membrane protein TolC